MRHEVVVALGWLSVFGFVTVPAAADDLTDCNRSFRGEGIAVLPENHIRA
jgi:hypothetical protein